VSAVLETIRLTKTFGRTQAVRAVSLRVEEGETFGFLGKNGAGKSTFIELVCGLLPPDDGEVVILGRHWRRVPPSARQHIGYVAQEPRFDPSSNADDIGRFIAPFYPTFDSRFFSTLLDLLSVPKKTRSDALSTGMRTRLALALALAHRPRLLILDEPTAGLDPLARHEFHALLLETARLSPRATFFSSHLIEDVQKLAQRVAIIDAGVVDFIGPLSALTEEVRAFPATARGELVSVGAVLGDKTRLLGVSLGTDEWVGRATPEAWQRLGVPTRALSFEEALVAVIGRRRER
jgi:ABC-2 type transport system ATP-binding protein